MSQVAIRKIGNSWVSLESIVALDSSTEYYLQNRGDDVLVACEADSEPQDNEGVLILPYKTFNYKKGAQNLYLKSFSANCTVNISDESSDEDGGGDKKKYNLSIDCLLGDTNLDGGLIIAHEAGDLVFTGVTYIASQALMWKFYNANILSVSFPDLTRIHTPSACESGFKNCAIASISWDKLDELSGTEALKEAFYNTQVTSVTIPSSTITGRRVLEGAFARCHYLTTVSFTNLTTLGSETSQFDNMLQGNTGVTVHFPSAMESTMQNWTSVTNGFGGTNTTILFDL